MARTPLQLTQLTFARPHEPERAGALRMRTEPERSQQPQRRCVGAVARREQRQPGAARLFEQPPHQRAADAAPSKLRAHDDPELDVALGVHGVDDADDTPLDTRGERRPIRVARNTLEQPIDGAASRQLRRFSTATAFTSSGSTASPRRRR